MYNMFREEGIRISLMYSKDGHWRVISFEEGTDEEGFAQTKMANLERPYGENCSWGVKYNMVGESGMVEAPDLEVTALNKGETIIQKVKALYFPNPIISTTTLIWSKKFGSCKHKTLALSYMASYMFASRQPQIHSLYSRHAHEGVSRVVSLLFFPAKSDRRDEKG